MAGGLPLLGWGAVELWATVGCASVGICPEWRPMSFCLVALRSLTGISDLDTFFSPEVAQTVGTLRRAIGRLNRFFFWLVFLWFTVRREWQERLQLMVYRCFTALACQLRLEGGQIPPSTTLFCLLDHSFNLWIRQKFAWEKPAFLTNLRSFLKDRDCFRKPCRQFWSQIARTRRYLEKISHAGRVSC